jgi:hypothetical protein
LPELQPGGMSGTPTPEQEQQAKSDLLLLDIETRTRQVQRLQTYERWLRIAMTAVAIFGAGAAFATLILHLTGWQP